MASDKTMGGDAACRSWARLLCLGSRGHGRRRFTAPTAIMSYRLRAFEDFRELYMTSREGREDENELLKSI